jgi:hypothetical protein
LPENKKERAVYNIFKKLKEAYEDPNSEGFRKPEKDELYEEEVNHMADVFVEVESFISEQRDLGVEMFQKMDPLKE